MGNVGKVLSGDSAPVGLKKPYAVAADSRGRVFVGDTGWGQVMVFDAQAQKFDSWGRSGPGMLRRPVGLAVSGQDHLFVADQSQKRVVRFDSEGKFLQAYGMPGELMGPTGVALDEKRGRLYVVDTKGHRVVVFGAQSGKRIANIGGRGNVDGRFNFPTNVAVGPDGRIYVMDTFNFRVQIFNARGKYVSHFGKNCTGFGCFSRSKGIALDSDGHIYVSDAAFNAVQIFKPTKEGADLLLFFGGVGHDPGRMWLPAGMYIDKKDRIYVADQYNYRVNVYQYTGDASVAAQPAPAPAKEAPKKEPPKKAIPGVEPVPEGGQEPAPK
jgi:DNA-binding beta-propeller fold protein YncE